MDKTIYISQITFMWQPPFLTYKKMFVILDIFNMSIQEKKIVLGSYQWTFFILAANMVVRIHFSVTYYPYYISSWINLITWWTSCKNQLAIVNFLLLFLISSGLTHGAITKRICQPQDILPVYKYFMAMLYIQWPWRILVSEDFPILRKKKSLVL